MSKRDLSVVQKGASKNYDEPIRPVHTHTHHKMPVLSVLTPRNHPNLLLTASEDGSLTSIDQRTRKVTARLAFPAAYPMCMAVVDGDNCLYVGDKAGGLHLVDCTGGKLIKAILLFFSCIKIHIMQMRGRGAGQTKSGVRM